MKVFKFGGASIKSANEVRNLASILRNFNTEKLILVVSAMGKTTNALEKVVDSWYSDPSQLENAIKTVIDFHEEILTQLFPLKSHPVYYKLNLLFGELEGYLAGDHTGNYDYDYDQIVSLGELISSTIISEYLIMEELANTWADIRNVIFTDKNWRDANVSWDYTAQKANEILLPMFKNGNLIITQGFLGGTESGFTTTLGREGSDYSASILAYSLDAEEVVVWKDVPGILNADPRYFENTSLLKSISYNEAIELTYYGASVIHPKTIKPLQNKQIPLKVKSFLEPEKEGTLVGGSGIDDTMAKSIILKQNQTLVTFKSRDFSFIAEKNLSEIFAALAECHIRVNLMQQSAISFTVCFDENEMRFNKLLSLLQDKFECRFNEKLLLITIRHYDQLTINAVLKSREPKAEQRSRTTAQFVVDREG